MIQVLTIFVRKMNGNRKFKISKKECYRMSQYFLLKHIFPYWLFSIRDWIGNVLQNNDPFLILKNVCCTIFLFELQIKIWSIRLLFCNTWWMWISQDIGYFYWQNEKSVNWMVHDNTCTNTNYLLLCLRNTKLTFNTFN